MHEIATFHYFNMNWRKGVYHSGNELFLYVYEFSMNLYKTGRCTLMFSQQAHSFLCMSILLL